MSPFEEGAPYYVGLGWQVFPLAEGSKIPAIPASKGGRGFKDATDDADEISRFAKEWPRSNIGIATGAVSGIVVIDIDLRNGGTRSLADLAGRGFVFPATAEARSGNGGRHFIYAHQAGVKGSKNRLGMGIDVKSDGGYIVGAPSVIARSDQGSGGQYRWVVAPRLLLPCLPKWAVDRLKPAPKPLTRFEPNISSERAERSLNGHGESTGRLAVGASQQRPELGSIHSWQAGPPGETFGIRGRDDIGAGGISGRFGADRYPGNGR